MRTHFLTLGLLLSLSAHSQSFKLMPFGGVGSSSLINANDYPDLHNLISLEGGVDVQRDLGKHFSVVSGIEYVSTGYSRSSTYQFDPLSGTTSGEVPNIHFQYLRVPLEARYDHMINRKCSIGIQTGVAGSWLLGVTSNEPYLTQKRTTNQWTSGCWPMSILPTSLVTRSGYQ